MGGFPGAAAPRKKDGPVPKPERRGMKHTASLIHQRFRNALAEETELAKGVHGVAGGNPVGKSTVRDRDCPLYVPTTRGKEPTKILRRIRISQLQGKRDPTEGQAVNRILSVQIDLLIDKSGGKEHESLPPGWHNEP